MSSVDTPRTNFLKNSSRAVVANVQRPESFAGGIVAISSLLAFFWFRNNYSSIFTIRPNLSAVVAGLSLALGLVFHRVRYASFPRIFSSYTRATAAGVLFYLIVEPPDFTLANAQYENLAVYVNVGYWIAFTAAILSLWRPSFLFPASLFVLSSRFASMHMGGFSASILDIQYMMEIGQFLSLSSCGLALLSYFQVSARAAKVRSALSCLDATLLAKTFVFIAFGLHLGNYFWSGYAKMVIGPHIWSWVWQNKTQNLVIEALMRGALPTGPFPTLTQRLFDGFSAVVIPSNVFVFVIQLMALFVVMRLAWLRLATLLYDAFHIGIYVFGGLLFWPWIWNNASILVAVRNCTDDKIGWLPKACCVVAILLGGSHLLGDSARLAWFDLVDIKVPSIQVEAPDGKWVDVPPSFFLGHSYQFSHGNEDLVSTKGHYPPTQWGIGTDYNWSTTTGQCLPPPPVLRPETAEEFSGRVKLLKKFLIAHQKKILQRVDADGHYDFYFRSHHHPSNPWLFHEFNALDLRQMHRYRLLTQSVCLKLREGALVKRELNRSEVLFDVN